MKLAASSAQSADPQCVFVIDDDHGARTALARLLRSADWNCETYSSPSEFLARPPYSGRGCIILDVQMPDMTGIELHNMMIEKGIDLPVVFLTGHGDVPMGVRAMKKGAVDFLLKPADDLALLGAVNDAVARHAVDHARDRERQHVEARVGRLSVREREIMEEVIRGRLNKQIAADLGISVKTTKTHRGRMMRKMESRSVAELVRVCDLAGIRPQCSRSADR